MPAIKHRDFYKGYEYFIKVIFNQVRQRVIQLSTEYELLIDLESELLSEEAKMEFMRILSTKSIRENAALMVLSHEHKHVADFGEREGKKEYETFATMADEVLGSTKEIFSELPSWLKASIKVIQEMLKMQIPKWKIWKRKNKRSLVWNQKYVERLSKVKRDVSSRAQRNIPP